MEIFITTLIATFVFIFLVLLFLLLPQRIFKQRFQKFQPFRFYFQNSRDYFLYSLKGDWHSGSYFMTALKFVCDLTKIPAIISAVLLVLQFFTDRAKFFKTFSENWLQIFIIAPPALYFILQCLIDRNRIENTSIDILPSAYEHVSPPDQWQSIDLSPNIRKLQEIGVRTFWEAEPIIVNPEVDSWLLSAQQAISIEYDREYKKRIQQKLWKKPYWKELYQPFLRSNYLLSQSSRKQFYNELKFGISQELSPNCSRVKLHQTCYYDSFLTNIIPGRVLRKNVNSREETGTEGIMPFEPGKRQLRKVGDYVAANEPGVTTLFLLPDEIILWRQNRLTQSSVNRIAASGSGSVDWDDCVRYLKNEPDGFREAIVYGMQRELWEECYEERNIKERYFMEKVETLITGYFRWLQKAGKPEFVGVTRLRDEVDLKQDYVLIDSIKAESTEIEDTKNLPAKSVGQFLLNFPLSYDANLHKCGIEDYSVPCAVALLRLRELCDKFCEDCPNKGKDCAKTCKVNVAETAFSGRTAIRV